MRELQDDDVSWTRSPAAQRRASGPAAGPVPAAVDPPAAPGGMRWLAVGLLLAGAASVAVVFTEDALYLRVALLAVCWAFVIAAFLAGGRRAEQLAAAGREAELRHAYDLEIEREVSARHEYEVELEARLRREAEDAMRAELTALRGELAGLAQLRTEVAAVAGIRTELAGLGELRGELARIRAELGEQLSGELLIERMVMRAQSVRGPAPADDDRTVESAPAWAPASAPSRTDAPPAVPRPIGAAPPVPPPARGNPAPPPSPVEWLIGESVLQPSAEPAPLDTDSRPARVPDPAPAQPAPLPPLPPVPVASRPAQRRHRRAAEPDDDAAVRPATSRTPAADPAPAAIPAYDGARYDELLFGTRVPVGTTTGATAYSTPSAEPAGATAWQPPSDPWEPSDPWPPRGADAEQPVHPEPVPAERARPEPQGHARLEQILAESGVQAPSGSRSRRRRYRDEDAGPVDDDVLARVLGRQ